ncbi:MAG: MATE family efflux transporter [Betaproteobacteria bacterium]
MNIVPVPEAADKPAPGLLRLAWPIFAEQALHMLTGVVGTLMASHIGDNAVAGLGSAWQILVMFLMGFNVLAVGASIATTHHLGMGDRDGARRLARSAVATNLWLGALFSVILAVTAPTLLRWAQLTPPLMVYALPFLQWMGGTLFLESMNFALCAVLRAHGHMREVMYVTLGQNVVNAGLSAALIFGVGGLPVLGVTGIAIAAVVSRLLACIALWLLVNHHIRLRLRARDLVTIRLADLRRLMSLGFPAVLESISWFASFMIITALTARMGERTLATQSYAMQIASMEMLACLSIGIANEIIIGRLIGAGRFEEAKVQCLANMRLGLIVTVGVACVFALLAPWALRMFTEDPQIVSLGRILITLGLLLEPGRSFNLIIINALRASGDSRFPLIAGLISQWGIMLFGAWILGTVLGFGLVGVWIALIADEWLRGLFMLQRWRRGRWLKHAKRVQALAASHPAIDSHHERLQSRSFT